MQLIFYIAQIYVWHQSCCYVRSMLEQCVLTDRNDIFWVLFGWGGSHWCQLCKAIQFNVTKSHHSFEVYRQNTERRHALCTRVNGFTISIKKKHKRKINYGNIYVFHIFKWYWEWHLDMKISMGRCRIKIKPKIMFKQETPQCDETRFSTIQPSIDMTWIRMTDGSEEKMMLLF